MVFCCSFSSFRSCFLYHCVGIFCMFVPEHFASPLSWYLSLLRKPLFLNLFVGIFLCLFGNSFHILSCTGICLRSAFAVPLCCYFFSSFLVWAVSFVCAWITFPSCVFLHLLICFIVYLTLVIVFITVLTFLNDNCYCLCPSAFLSLFLFFFTLCICLSLELTTPSSLSLSPSQPFRYWNTGCFTVLHPFSTLCSCRSGHMITRLIQPTLKKWLWNVFIAKSGNI